jgi:hypothetical protein
MKSFKTWLGKHHILWILLIALAVWLPRGLDLDRFVTTDETPWLMRSANFYYALGQRDFAKTDQGLNPGVTTMWVNSAAFLWIAPEYRGFGQGYFRHYIDFDKFVQEKGIDPHEILVGGRTIMLIENTILLVIAFVIAIRLFGLYPALAGFLLIAFNPFHISLTLVSHMDGQLSNLMLVSILAFLGYLYDKPRLIYIFVSTVAASLACLTKLPAYMLFPALGIIIMIAGFNIWKRTYKQDKRQFRIWVGRMVRHLVIWAVVFAGVYVVVWPAMWVDPVGTFVEQVEAPFIIFERNNLINDAIGDDPAEEMLETSGDTLKILDFYPQWYLRLETPVVLFGILAALGAYYKKAPPFDEENKRSLTSALIVFVIIYTLGIGYIDKQNPRYMIPAAIALNLLAALGWFAVVGRLNKLKNVPFKHLAIAILMGVIVFFQLGGVIQTYPYYYSYFNPLLGGSRVAGESYFIGSGEGLDEAGRYLSRKPGAEDMTVLSWYGSGSFSYFFSGTTIIIPTGITNNDYIARNLVGADYLVTYTNQWYRRIPPELFEILDNVVPEHSIWINDIEYAHIYAVSELPPEVFEYQE